jgi:hypothetical protein
MKLRRKVWVCEILMRHMTSGIGAQYFKTG